MSAHPGSRKSGAGRTTSIRLRQHARLVPPEQGDVRVAASVGPSGEVVALWAAAVDAPALTSRTTDAHGASFADPRTPRPVAVRVTRHGPAMAVTARIAKLQLAHPFVQPLPDGRTLLVGGRCRARPTGADRNAIVYDSDGRVLARHTLGDGIQHVAATPRGEVWVGYFDEGILGSYGWGEQGEPPLGARGLTRYSTALRPAWHFPAQADDPWGGISDCYALNVAGDTAWTCYYMDFPIVRIHDDTVTGWRNDAVAGASALATDGSRVALFKRGRLIVGVLGNGRLTRTGQYRLLQPDGRSLPIPSQVVGQGPELHILTGADWLRVGIDDLPG